MAGCFGNSIYDKAIERELDRYLDLESQEEWDEKEDGYCHTCGEETFNHKTHSHCIEASKADAIMSMQKDER